MSEPRWLDADAAADHLSLRIDAFYRHVRSGRVPKPSYHLGERTPRWDRASLDAIMAGGTASTNTRIAVDALAEKIKNEGRARRMAQGM